MNVWIMNHYAGKNGHRHYEISKRLSAHGYDVSVILSSHQWGIGKYTFSEKIKIETIDDQFHYVWLKTKPDYLHSSVKRVFNMIDYALLIKKYANFLVQKLGAPDVIIASSVHPLAWEAGRYLANKYRAKLILELRDEWPLTLIEIGGISKYHPIIVFFDYINKRALRKADAFIGTSKGMHEYIRDRYHLNFEKRAWVPNGYDAENIIRNAQPAPLPLRELLEKNWCVTYIGSITVAEGLGYLVNVIEQFNQQCGLPIHFLIIGEGNEKERIIEKVNSLNLSNVTIYGGVNHDTVYSILSQSKVCVAPARFSGELAKYGLSMNKLNDYLFSGKPTILTYEGENVVLDSESGYCIGLEDLDGFIECLKKLYEMSEDDREYMGEQGRKEIKKNYNFDLLTEKYIDIIETV